MTASGFCSLLGGLPRPSRCPISERTLVMATNGRPFVFISAFFRLRRPHGSNERAMSCRMPRTLNRFRSKHRASWRPEKIRGKVLHEPRISDRCRHRHHSGGLGCHDPPGGPLVVRGLWRRLRLRRQTGAPQPSAVMLRRWEEPSPQRTLTGWAFLRPSTICWCAASTSLVSKVRPLSR